MTTSRTPACAWRSCSAAPTSLIGRARKAVLGQVLERARAARCGAGERARRCRIHLPQGAVAAPRGQADRGRAAAAAGPAQRLAAAQSRRMVDRAPAGRPQAARRGRTSGRLSWWRAMRCRRPRTIRAPSTSSPPAGSRCASLNNPQAAYQHFARVGHGTSNPITIARGEYWQGRALEAMGRNGEARAPLSGRRAAFDRLLRADRARAARARRVAAAPPAGTRPTALR